MPTVKPRLSRQLMKEREVFNASIPKPLYRALRRNVVSQTGG